MPPVPRPLLDIEVGGTARRSVPLAVLITPPSDDTERSAEPDPPYADLVAELRATGKAGEVQFVPGGGGPTWLVGVGGGEAAQYRTAGAAFIRAANAFAEAESAAGRRVPRTVQVELPDDAGSDGHADFTTGVLLGGYRYEVTAEEPKPEVRTVRVLTGAPHAGSVDRARALAGATALARDLANAPSNVKDPAWLAGVAERVAAQTPGLSGAIRDEAWLAEQRFGGVLAVGGGSASPPRLIELTYRPRGASGHLLLVGKGITFDTGGLSVKPAQGMHLMRTDMAGGAAVIAAMRAIAALKPDVRVTALVPAAENHISGSAYRPGDVVRHYGGRTTEVGNTDAEGRMVLADALAYGVRRFSPDAVVDVATLTGAMKVALGMRTGGLFASDDDLAERISTAGDRAGERWWRMPLVEDHADDVRSEIADVRQAPAGPGGITAALFLREFAGGVPWAHLDIAGPARSEKNYDEVTPGGTGFAARTLVELATGW